MVTKEIQWNLNVVDQWGKVIGVGLIEWVTRMQINGNQKEKQSN